MRWIPDFLTFRFPDFQLSCQTNSQIPNCPLSRRTHESKTLKGARRPCCGTPLNSKEIARVLCSWSFLWAGSPKRLAPQIHQLALHSSAFLNNTLLSSQQGFLQRISYLGAIGQGSSWDLRVCLVNAVFASLENVIWELGKCRGPTSRTYTTQQSPKLRTISPKCPQGTS